MEDLTYNNAELPVQKRALMSIGKRGDNDRMIVLPPSNTRPDGRPQPRLSRRTSTSTKRDRLICRLQKVPRKTWRLGRNKCGKKVLLSYSLRFLLNLTENKSHQNKLFFDYFSKLTKSHQTKAIRTNFSSTEKKKAITPNKTHQNKFFFDRKKRHQNKFLQNMHLSK